jgi:hypothetical protein
MSSKSALRTISIFFVAVTLAATAAASPRITLVDPVKDFGTVPKGEVLNWDFTIKNTGDEDLQILRVQPACGCTVAEFDSVIAPGQTGRVVAQLRTESFQGPINKPISIQSNDPDSPTTQVAIKAIVKPYVEAHPAGFIRFNLLQGEVAQRSVVLYSEEDEPFEILGIDVPGEWITAEHEKLTGDDRVPVGRADQNQYRVTVTLGGPDAPVGPLMDKVRIRTNSKHQPEYMLNLSGIVRPGYNVTPSVLNFGEIHTGVDPEVRVIVLRTNNPQSPAAFRIEKVESSSPALFDADARLTAPGQYEVEVRLSRNAAPGQIDGDLTIYTSDAGTPVVTVPVKALVRS